MIDRAQRTLRRLRALFRDDEMTRDLDEEIEAHLEMAVEENLRRGLPPEEARRQGWPEGARLRVPFEIDDGNGGKFIHYEYFESIDVSSGPGAPNTLNPAKTDAKTAKKFQDAGWEFGPDAVAKGSVVAVIAAAVAARWRSGNSITACLMATS